MCFNNFKTFLSPRQTKYSTLTLFKRIVYAQKSIMFCTTTRILYRFDLKNIVRWNARFVVATAWVTNDRRQQTIYVIKSSSCLTGSSVGLATVSKYEIICLMSFVFIFFWQTYGFSICRH